MENANNQTRGLLSKLQTKWKLNSLWQVLIVLLVFACTGFTVLLIKEPIFNFMGISIVEGGVWKTIAYLLLVLPLYQAILLIYGFIFGQFNFFWEKEKQFLQRMGKIFSRQER